MFKIEIVFVVTLCLMSAAFFIRLLLQTITKIPFGECLVKTGIQESDLCNEDPKIVEKWKKEGVSPMELASHHSNAYRQKNAR